MPTKILHTSDIHIDKSFLWLGQNSESHKRDLNSTFQKICTYTIEHDVDILLIAGDLFDIPDPSSHSIAFVQSELSRLAQAQRYTVILPGNHDPYKKNSVYQSTFFASNPYIHVFSQPHVEVHTIAAHDISFWAQGVVSPDTKYSQVWRHIVDNAENTPLKTKKVAIAHTSLTTTQKTTHDTLDPDVFAHTPFDYIALGDWHTYREVSSSPPCYYSGAPELLISDQAGTPGVIEIELDQKTTCRFLKTGKYTSKTIDIDIDHIDLNDSLATSRYVLSKISPHCNPDTVIIANITGYRSLKSNWDIAAIQDQLSNQTYKLIIKDNTKTKLDQHEIQELSHDPIIAKFLELVTKDIKSEKDPIKQKLLEDVLVEGIQRLNGTSK